MRCSCVHERVSELCAINLQRPSNRFCLVCWSLSINLCETRCVCVVMEFPGGAHTYTMQRVISVHCQVISWHHQSSRHLITGRQYMFCWWINRPDSFASVNCFEVRPLHCSVCMSVIYVLSTSSIVSHTQFHRYWAWFLVLRIMRVSVCVRGGGFRKTQHTVCYWHLEPAVPEINWRVMRKNVFPAVIGVHSSSPYRIPHRDKVISLSFKLADLIKHSSMRSGPKENVAVTDSCATWPNFLR